MVNLNGDSGHQVDKLVLHEQCYEIVMDSLRSLTGRNGNSKEFNSSQVTSGPSLDQATRDNYIRQIIQLCVQWPDTAFHEHLYRTLIDLGLENELLEYGGSDLVPFLQSAGHKLIQEVCSSHETYSFVSPHPAFLFIHLLHPYKYGEI